MPDADTALRLACPACGTALRAEPILRGKDRLHGVPGTFDVHVCTACASGLTTPLVELGELDRFYPSEYGAFDLPTHPALRAAATTLFRFRYRRALRRLPLNVLRDRPSGRLLDVGSGRGDLGVIAKELGWKTTGLEPSADAAAAARSRGVRTEVGTLATAELESPYDVVVFQHSLEHVVDPLADLRRAGELLERGGAVLVTVPNFGSWQARRFGDAWFHLDLPRHRAHFTTVGLLRLLERAGFADARTATSTSADGLPMSLEYRLLGRRRRGAGRYVEIGAVLALAPLTAVTNLAVRDGDLLHAVAAKP
jgi:SAM-dependent methyltransferase